jgi:CRP-like cAMP-binding protein
VNVPPSEQKPFQILEDVIFLKKTDLFASMETSELRAIATIAEEFHFDKGGVIVREDDVGDSLYIIKNGSVKITKKVNDSETVTLAEMTRGNCFGEMALFDAELRSASVQADTPCILLCIKSDDLHDLLLDYPTIAIEFLKIFVKRLRAANKTIENLSAGRKG